MATDAAATPAAPQPATVDAPGPDAGLLDGILDKQKVSTETRADVTGAVQSLTDWIQRNADLIPKNADLAIRAVQAELDQKLSAQLNAILHEPKFQALAGTWEGLAHLVYNTRTSRWLKLKVLNVSKDTLAENLDEEVEFDQNALFKKVYEDEYGQLGGHPFSMLVTDYEFDGRNSGDVNMLKKLAGVAAAAHAPVVAAASPGMFDLKSFTDLNNPRDLEKIFEQPDYLNWQGFRDRPDSRYVALTLPRVLARLPYDDTTENPSAGKAKGFVYREEVDGSDHAKYQWMSAAWAYAVRVTDAFSKDGWFMRTRGVETGGLVTDLPMHTYTDAGGKTVKCPTEVMIPDRRENELSKLGFLPILYAKNSDKAAFLGTQTTQRPKNYPNTEAGNAAKSNAQLSARLSYLLCVSRIAHYLKAIARDKIGSFQDKDRMQTYLENWINEYVLSKPENAGPDEIAKKPLREARITVEDVPGMPGSFQAVAHLRPHFQMEELAMSLRLVAELPKKAGGG